MISAEELEMLAFLGVDPKTEDDTPWPFSDFLFEVETNDISLSCAIAPVYKDVRFIMKYRDQMLYKFNSVGFKDVGNIEEANGTNVLEITVNDKESLGSVITPNIVINHYYENTT